MEVSDFQNTQTRVNFPVRGFSLKYNAAATDHTTRLRHIAEWVIERLAKKNLLRLVIIRGQFHLE